MVMKIARRHHRRGIALAEVIVGGVILAVGLGVIMSIMTRSLVAQTAGEKRVTASWLCDELLSMVVVEGPDRYGRTNDTSGQFTDPFSDFSFDLQIDEIGRGAPYEVVATVWWSERPNDQVSVRTLISVPAGERQQPREPYEPLDFDARYYDEDEEATSGAP